MGLASYEGIIHPQKISFIGGIPRGNLVALTPTIQYYTSLDIELNFVEPPEGIPLHERILFSETSRLGSPFPLWEGIFDENKAIVKFMIFAERGSKVDFVRSKVEKQLIGDIEQFVPNISKIVKDVKMAYGREVWIDKTKAFSDKTNTSAIKLVDFSKSEKSAPLKKSLLFWFL